MLNTSKRDFNVWVINFKRINSKTPKDVLRLW